MAAENWLGEFDQMITGKKDSFSHIDFIKYESKFLQIHFRNDPSLIDSFYNKKLLDRETQKIINEMTALCSKYNQELEALSRDSQDYRFLKNNISYFRMETIYMKIYITELLRRYKKKQSTEDLEWVLPQTINRIHN